MENISPQDRTAMENEINALKLMAELPVNEYFATKRLHQLRAVKDNPRTNPAKTSGLEREFSVYNTAVMAGKEADDKFEKEYEQLCSTHFSEDPLDGEPGA